jgi:hypothetical protein
MPKKTTKGAREKADAATAQSGDDFDNMLAKVRASDVAISTTSTSSSEVTATETSSCAIWPGEVLPDQTILGACKRGNAIQLRRWGQLGIRVISGEPLYESAANGASLDVLRCLVNELGADVNKAVEGNTPLRMAVQNNHLGVVECLVKELRADVNQVNDTGATALLKAVQQGHLAVVECLVKELGANVNHAASCGSTALHVAAENGNLAVVRCLLKVPGVDINRRRNDGATPLILASCHKHTQVVIWLVKRGADVQTTSKYGTAENLSRAYGASIAQTAYLDAKTHCSNTGCSGAGLMKCTGCKQARYCGEACQLAHWKAHKAACKAGTKM